MIRKIYTIKMTNGRFTIPDEIRRKFGFFGKKVKTEADVRNGALHINLKNNS